MEEGERASFADESNMKCGVVVTGADDAAVEAKQETKPPLPDSSDDSVCSRPDGAAVAAPAIQDAGVVGAAETMQVTAITSTAVEGDTAAPPTTPIAAATTAASSTEPTSTSAGADDRDSAASSSTTMPEAVAERAPSQKAKALEQQAEALEQRGAAASDGDVSEKEKHGKNATDTVPAGGAGSPSKPASPSDDLREALVSFYNLHNPGRIGTLDVILKQYVGKEELLIDRLEQKYSADLSHARPAAVAAAAAARESGQLSQSPLPPQHSHRAGPPVLGEAPAQRGSGGGGGGSFVPPRPPSSVFTSGGNNTPSRSGGGASQHGLGNGATSSNYMTYLADQIRSNVEGFLPASSSGGAGGGNTSYPVSYAPFSPTTAGSEKPPAAAAFERAASAGGAGLMGAGSAGSLTVTTTTGGASNSSYAGRRHQYPQGESDPTLTARVRGLEEERAALLAACRRMQGKVDAASREAAATEELREAGQRKVTSFAERAVAAERKAREMSVRLRTLESGQAALKAEREASARRCAAKHNQLLSAIDLQMSLRFQLEGLLEVVPPSPRLALSPSASEATRELETLLHQDESGASATASGPAAAGALAADASAETCKETPSEVVVDASLPKAGEGSRVEGSKRRGPGGGTSSGKEVSQKMLVENAGGGDGGSDGSAGGDDEGRGNHDDRVNGGGDDGRAEGLDELRRRCSLLEVSLRAARREALEERRARDTAERTIRQQKEDLPRLKERVSELEACLAREQEAGKVASQAASGLEAELELRLDHLRKAETDLSEQTHANSRLREELRVASARLSAASSARASLVDFCRQERTAVERLAAEQLVRLEESAAARGEEHLARGLELAKMAEDLGDKRAAGLMLEVDRLGKALFASRARLAGTEAMARGLHRELERAADTIVDLSKSKIASSLSPSAAAVASGEDGGGLGSGEGVGAASGKAVEAGGADASRERSGGLTEEEALMIRSPSAAAAATESGASDSRGAMVPVPAVERATGKVRGGGGGSRKGSIHKLALAAGGLTRRAASSKTAARPLSKPGVSDGETPSTAAAVAAATTARQDADAPAPADKANRAQSPRVAGQTGFDVNL